MIIQIELDEKDQEAIALKVSQQLETTRTVSDKSNGNEIMDVKTLAEYLGTSASCIYKKVSFNEIPFFKVGKYTRFRKSKIDEWIESNSVKAVPAMKY